MSLLSRLQQSSSRDGVGWGRDRQLTALRMPGQHSLFFCCFPRQEPGKGRRRDIAIGVKLSSTKDPALKNQTSTRSHKCNANTLQSGSLGWMEALQRTVLGWAEGCRDIQTLPAFLTAAKGYRAVGPFANSNAFPRQRRKKHPAQGTVWQPHRCTT